MGGGKSAKTTVGYKQYAGASLVLAKLIHKILRISIGDNEAWTGEVSSESVIHIDKDKLYGASGTEGGFIGDIAFQPGLPTQEPDEYLVSKLGSHISANRGVSQFVFRQPYWGNNPYLKDIEVTGERVHMLDDGSEQWYDEKSAIPSIDQTKTFITINDTWDYVVLAEQPDPGHTNLTPPVSGWIPSSPGPFGQIGGSTLPPPESIQTTWPVYTVLWLRKTISVPANAQMTLTVQIENGCIVYANGVEIGSINKNNVDITTYPTADFQIGSYSTAQDIIIHVKAFDELTHLGSNTYIGLSGGYPLYQDLNPAHFMREILTNTEWGYGYEIDDIDDASFRAGADKLFSEKFGLSYLWEDDSVDLDSLFQKVQDTIDGACFVSRTTLKWTLKLIRNDYDPDALIELKADNEVLSITDYARSEFLDLTNTITVQFYNTQISGNGSLSITNAALFLQQGVRAGVTKNYEMCCNPLLAAKLAQRELNIASNPLASCSVIANSAGRDFERGDVFKLTSPKHNFNKTIMRVTGINRGDGKSRSVKIACAEDRFAMPQTAFITPQPPLWVDPSQDAKPILNRLSIEVPYAVLITAETQQTVDSILAASPDVGYVGIAGERVDGALNADIYVDAGSGFEDLAKLDFCPFGKLVLDIQRLDASFTVTEAQDLSELDTQGFLQIDDEILSFASRVGNVFSGVKRAVFDSIPAIHDSGAAVFFIENYLDGPQTQYAAGESVDVKLATNASRGTLALADAPTDTVALEGRAARPYPPGNVQINAEYWPDFVDGDAVVTWAHRDRKFQADQFVDFTASNIGPEAGQTYNIRLYDSTDTEVDSADAISGTTHTFTGLTAGAAYRIELESERDGLTSFKRHSLSFTTTGGGYLAENGTDFYAAENGTDIYEVEN